MPARIECDVAVIGAGVAGLWAWRRLRNRGLDALLVTAGPIGAGQTLASQGIIHGGVKYALTGEGSRASAMIAGMPAVWRACLAGAPAAGDPDLSGVRVLTDHQHLWTTRGIVSRLGGAAASKALRTDVARVGEAERPEAFRRAPAGIDVYRVEEPVVEPRSLAAALLGDAKDVLAVAEANLTPLSFWFAPTRGAGVLTKTHEGARVSLRPRAIVCAAGAGNEALLARCGIDPAGASQRRPLHMVMVRGDLPMLYGHCVTASSLPRATITSQRDGRGRAVWWVGGGIAEAGVEHGREEQIRHARRELAEAAPWVNLTGAEWATMRIDRAEGLPEGRPRTPGARPDEPVALVHGNVVFAWPTKLAFAPLLATMIERAIEPMLARPCAGPDEDFNGERIHERLNAEAQPVGIGALPWENPGVVWS